jgi:hypothetical protein
MDDDIETEVTGAEGKPSAGAPPRRRIARKSGGRKWEAVRNIDFRPEGLQSLRDLVAEKQPKSINERNLVAIYWLEQVLEIQEIGMGHLLAAYKEEQWREPSDLEIAARSTASRTHWLDTSNTKAIKTTPTGRNIVKHDMPLVKAKKA